MALPALKFQNSHRRFSSRPTKLVVEQFKEHLAKTNHPESFEGIYLDRIAPDQPFVILHEFELKQERREAGDMAFCPMCFRRDQYLQGRLVFLPSLEAIAAIGEDCAEKGTAQKAKELRKFETQRTVEEDFLIENLGSVSGLITRALELVPRAKEAQGVFRKLRSKATRFVGSLRRLRREDFNLVVYEDTSANDPYRDPLFANPIRRVHFGTLNGSIAVKADWRPVDELNASLRILNVLPQTSDEEETFEQICNMSDQERHWAYAQLRQEVRRLSKIEDQIEEFKGFFDADNLERIAKWASHKSQPDKFLLRHSMTDYGFMRLQIEDRGNWEVIEMRMSAPFEKI